MTEVYVLYRQSPDGERVQILAVLDTLARAQDLAEMVNPPLEGETPTWADPHEDDPAWVYLNGAMATWPLRVGTAPYKGALAQPPHQPNVTNGTLNGQPVTFGQYAQYLGQYGPYPGQVPGSPPWPVPGYPPGVNPFGP